MLLRWTLPLQRRQFSVLMSRLLGAKPRKETDRSEVEDHPEIDHHGGSVLTELGPAALALPYLPLSRNSTVPECCARVRAGLGDVMTHGFSVHLSTSPPAVYTLHSLDSLAH